MNSCIIRSEQKQDFHSISVVNAVSFTHSFSMGEVPLISVLRNRKEFDPDLSLVAEFNGEIIGHALFSPLHVSMKGEVLNAVILAPIAVLPEFQNKGVGSLLIEEGHKRAKKKGFHFSFLIGHPNYYPRFGYRPNMWSSSRIQIRANDIPGNPHSIEDRRIEIGDVELLCMMWDKWFIEANLGIKPGTSITDWISYGKAIHSSAILIDGELSGYLRYEKNDPSKIQSILAKDSETFMNICSYLKSKLGNIDELSLPLPFNSRLLEKSGIPFMSNIQSGPERMIKIFTEDNAHITNYCNDVLAGEIPPGQLLLPVEFEI